MYRLVIFLPNYQFSSVRIFILFLQQRPIKQSFCGSLRRDTHWKCLILSALISGCLGAIAWCRLTVVTRVVINFYEMPITQTAHASPCDDGYIYIPVAFVVMLYLVYLVECWHSHTRIELQYKVGGTFIVLSNEASGYKSTVLCNLKMINL